MDNDDNQSQLPAGPPSMVARELASCGVPEVHIAAHMRLSLAELRKRHAADMRDGNSEAIIKGLQLARLIACGGVTPAGRTIPPNPKVLTWWLSNVMGATTSPESKQAPTAKQVAGEVVQEVIKAIVGTPEEVAQFLAMRDRVRREEQAEDGVIIENENEF